MRVVCETAESRRGFLVAAGAGAALMATTVGGAAWAGVTDLELPFG